MTFIAIKYSVASKTFQLHVDGLKDEESVILSIKETCDRPVQTGNCGSGGGAAQLLAGRLLV